MKRVSKPTNSPSTYQSKRHQISRILYTSTSDSISKPLTIVVNKASHHQSTIFTPPKMQDNRSPAPEEKTFSAFKKVSSFKTFTLNPRPQGAETAQPSAPTYDAQSSAKEPPTTWNKGYGKSTAKANEIDEDTVMEDAYEPGIPPFIQTGVRSNDEAAGRDTFSRGTVKGQYQNPNGSPSSFTNTNLDPRAWTTQNHINHHLTPSSSGASSNTASHQHALPSYPQPWIPTKTFAEASHPHHDEFLSTIDKGMQHHTRFGNSETTQPRRRRATELEEARKVSLENPIIRFGDETDFGQQAMVADIVRRVGNWMNYEAVEARRTRPKAEDWF